MRILWVLKKQLDVTVDRSTYVAMVGELAALGHSVVLITGNKRQATDIGLGGRVRYVPTSPVPGAFHASFLLGAYVETRRFLMSQPPDVLVFDPFSAPAVAVALRQARVNHVRLVMDVRTLPGPRSSLPSWLRDAVFANGIKVGARIADGVAVITDALRDSLEREYGLPANLRGAVWSSGVDVDLFNPDRICKNMVREVRRQFKLDGRVILLYHGAIDLRRGLGELVEAFSLLEAATQSRLGLVLLGEGSGLAALRQSVARLGLEDAVRWVPSVPHERVPLFVAAGDVGVIPLPDLDIWRTSSPIKLFEYLAMKKPVVVTDIEAHHAVLGARPHAIYSHGSSALSLANALERLAAMSREAIGMAGEDGRDLVIESYTWTAQASRLSAFLEALR
jgi:glycosyltransferase involved in cell wall biosynthesis